MIHNKKYATISDLLTDDGFLAWFFKTDAAQEIAWDKWIAQNPEHDQLAKEAVHLIGALLSSTEKKLPRKEMDAAFEVLLKKLADKGKSAYWL